MFSRPPHPSSVSGFQSGRGPGKGLREDKAKRLLPWKGTTPATLPHTWHTGTRWPTAGEAEISFHVFVLVLCCPIQVRDVILRRNERIVVQSLPYTWSSTVIWGTNSWFIKIKWGLLGQILLIPYVCDIQILTRRFELESIHWL